MALPESLEVASTQADIIIPDTERNINRQTGEIAVAAAITIPELVTIEHHTKTSDPHKRTIHRAREAGRRLFF